MTNRKQLVALCTLAALTVFITVTYWSTVASLLGVGQFQEKTTDAALVVVVTMVLIWNSRERLSQAPIEPHFLALFPLLGLGFVWLCGELIFARIFTQFALLATLPAAVLAVCGTRWLRILAFPFFVLLFALPVWVVFVPALVKMSAYIAELAIKASNVPIYRDGAYFVLPSGSWSIADACSGVSFFSTSLLLGVLYAWTIFDSKRKRIFFVAGAAAIGVAGNWVRVYLTMMIAHLSDNRYLRDDHYMFGWYLFAGFLFSYFFFGWRYRDVTGNDGGSLSGVGGARTGELTSSMIKNTRKLVIGGLACILAIGIWPILHGKLAGDVGTTNRQIGEANPSSGWITAAPEARDWKPELKNAAFTRLSAFEKDGRRVTLFFGVYESESWNKKLVSVANQLAGGDGSKWSLADRGQAQTSVGESVQNVKSGIIVGNGVRLLAWHWYWIDGRQTSNDLSAKLMQLQSRLRGREPLSVWVTIATESNQSSADAERALSQFLQDMSPTILKSLAPSK